MFPIVSHPGLGSFKGYRMTKYNLLIVKKRKIIRLNMGKNVRMELVSKERWLMR